MQSPRRRAGWVALVCLALLPALLACSGASHSGDKSLDERLQFLLPGLTLGETKDVDTNPGPFRIAWFQYRSQQGDWPYGQGFALRGSSEDDVVWVHLHHGDYPPRQPHWADFDGDARADLFFHAGMEDVFETFVFLNRVTVSRFAVTNFVLGYHEPHAYAVVVDLDADGSPELLVPEPQDTENDAIDLCLSSLTQGDLTQEIAEEYAKLCGRFAPFNFTYDLPSYPIINMGLLDRIKLVSLREPQRIVTSRHREHLRWRLAMTERLQSAVPDTCTGRLDATERYLRELLDVDG